MLLTTFWSRIQKPLKLLLTDDLGKTRIIDNKSQLRWYSHGANPDINWRETPYAVNLTDYNENNLYSMDVFFIYT